jgi:hypothetical protein
MARLFLFEAQSPTPRLPGTCPSSPVSHVSRGCAPPPPPPPPRLPVSPHFPADPTQDMILVFFTAQYDELQGVWLFHVKTVAKAYSRRWLWVDLVHGCLCLCAVGCAL